MPALERPTHSAAHTLSPRRTSRDPGRWLPRSLALVDLALRGDGISLAAAGLLGSPLAETPFRRSRPPQPGTSSTGSSPGDRQPASSPALRVSSRVQHPVVVGVLRPTILIPPSYDEPDTDPELLTAQPPARNRPRRAIRSRGSARSPAWPRPSGSSCRKSGGSGRNSLIDQEFLADRSAALRYGTSSGYAASLLALAESRHDSALADAAPDEHWIATWPAGGKDARIPALSAHADAVALSVSG